jgi:peptide/nickel transport system permease protein
VPEKAELLVDVDAAQGRADISPGERMDPSKQKYRRGWWLARVLVRQVVVSVPLLFVVSALTFVLVSITPGDATTQILGLQATPAQVASLRHALGLNLPLYDQYWRWVKHAAAGDMGRSTITLEKVTKVIADRTPTTLSLVIGSMLLIVVVGVGLGLVSSVRGGALGRLVDALSLVGFALPAFWVGAVLIALFAVKLRWLPAVGYVGFTHSPLNWARSLVLPVVALSLYGVAVVAKQTREAMLDALGSEYIRASRANGISERSIIFRHALKNASLPIVTVLGLQVISLLGSAVLVENVFALPGLGSLLVTASIQHDLPVVQGIVICFTVVVVGVNLIIDLMYSLLDPRVRTR